MSKGAAEEVKSKIDIVEFLKGYLTLQPAGRNFKALCPFHKEKTPSFMISPDRQSWRCFGCGIGGDAFAFLMRYENLEFGEALKMLAEKAGVELKRLSPAEYEQLGALYDVNTAARDYFLKQLKASKIARDYLASRGLQEATIEEFELGFATEAAEGLALTLIKQGFRPDLLVRAGLTFRAPSGLYLDRFRGRLIFPLHNHLGKVIGFTGRVLPQFENSETAKYMNTPETPIFSKSRLLYGFHRSKNIIRETKSVFLVEGQMDFLMSWQSGVRHVVATSGTAFTLDHLKTLQRLTDELVLSFDNDEAGLVAGERVIDLALKNDLNVKVVSLQGAFKDPAEAAQANPEALQEALKEAQPAAEFFFRRYLGDFLEKKKLPQDFLGDFKRGLRAVLLRLKRMSSAVERQFWLKELSYRTGVDLQALSEELAQMKDDALHDEGVAVGLAEREILNKPQTRRELLSKHLLALAHTGKRLTEIPEMEAYGSTLYREGWRLLKDGKVSSEDPYLDECLEEVLLIASRPFEEQEFLTLRQYLKEEYLRERRRELQRMVAEAERTGNEEALKKALIELQASWQG